VGDTLSLPARLLGPAAPGELLVSPSTETAMVAEQDIGGPGQPSLLLEAETCLLEALKIARRQQAKSLELRAALGLSMLWQRQRQGARLAGCWQRLIASSPRDLTRRTLKRPRRCSPNSHEVLARLSGATVLFVKGLRPYSTDTSWGCQGVWCFTMAFRIVSSLRIQAVRATFATLPAARRRS
jgi:hypothetical protein